MNQDQIPLIVYKLTPRKITHVIIGIVNKTLPYFLPGGLHISSIIFLPYPFPEIVLCFCS